jgi:hypothetical protein
VVAGAAWVARGAGDPLERQQSAVVPAFVEATVTSQDRPRTLVLQQTDSGRVRYTLLRSAGARLGDAEPEQEPRAGSVLDRVVADLTSGRGGTDVQTLAGFGTRYVLLLGKPSDALVGDLDSVPGLERVGAPVEGVLWSLTGPTGRVRLLGGGPGAVVPSAQVGVDAQVPAATAARTVALAEAADPRWRATLDGRPLASRTVDGWAQGFTLPAEGGRLVIEHEDPRRLPWLAGAAATLVLTLLLALPAIRVSGPSDDEAP